MHSITHDCYVGRGRKEKGKKANALRGKKKKKQKITPLKKQTSLIRRKNEELRNKTQILKPEAQQRATKVKEGSRQALRS